MGAGGMERKEELYCHYANTMNTVKYENEQGKGETSLEVVFIYKSKLLVIKGIPMRKKKKLYYH